MAAMREKWFETFEDLEREFNRKLEAANKKAQQMEERALKAEVQRDEALDKITDQRHRIYEAGTELEEGKGKNQKLLAQLNRDYENSSLTSAQTIRHKKICNSREKTGRKPGGQQGHKGHCRKKQVPTKDPILLPPPQEVLGMDSFAGFGIVINICMVLGHFKHQAYIYQLLYNGL